MMEMNHDTSVPPISSASADETDIKKVPDPQSELEQWRQEMKTLKEKENYEDQVTNTNVVHLFCSLYSHC